jgi:adenylate cyclase
MILGTVRRKLTALVAFSAAAALVVLPLLSWLMHRQLVDEVDDRVPEALHGFDEELADDLRDLDVTARALAEQAATADAITKRDAAALEKLAGPFRDAYPDLDIIFYDAADALVGEVGCDHPQPARPHTAIGKHVVLPHGCEASATGSIAIGTVRALGTAGFVVVCLPLDANYFTNSQSKLGGELALETTVGGRRAVAQATAKFPVAQIAEATADGAIVEAGSSTYAVARFEPPALADADTGDLHLEFAAALDVSDIKAIVRRHLLLALAIIGSATLISIAVGWALASRMSRALTRVNNAMQKLEQQEYVKVDVLKTGDELEDLATGFNAMVDGLKERDKLRTTMGKYMTAAVVSHLMAGEVELGGKSLEVTILFCDLRDFTTLSEKRSAQEIVGLLNEYFTEMVDCVMAEGGVVDKYIGDNIMAVFGAPVSRADDATHAVRAAIRMRAALAALNTRFATRGLPPLRFGIGLHTGEVVAGNIGSAKRMEYTVIGDAVNLASRLESKTKELVTDILISGETYALVKSEIDAEVSGEVHVKGREQAVTAYKVRGLLST